MYNAVQYFWHIRCIWKKGFLVTCPWSCRKEPLLPVLGSGARNPCYLSLVLTVKMKRPPQVLAGSSQHGWTPSYWNKKQCSIFKDYSIYMIYTTAKPRGKGDGKHCKYCSSFEKDCLLKNDPSFYCRFAKNSTNVHVLGLIYLPFREISEKPKWPWRSTLKN